MVMSKYTKRTFTVTVIRVADIIGIVLAGLFFSHNSALVTTVYDNMLIVILCIVLAVMIFPLFAVYSSWRVKPIKHTLQGVTVAWVASFAVLIILVFMLDLDSSGNKQWLLYWFFTVLSYMLILRVCGYYLLGMLREKGRNTRSLVMIGNSDLLRKVKSIIKKRKELGFVITKVAILDQPDNENDDNSHYPLVSYDEIVEKCNTASPDEVWIFLPIEEVTKLKNILQDLSFCTSNIRWIPSLRDHTLLSPSVAEIGDYRIYNLAVSPFADPVNRLIKRIEDILIGSFILLLISPVMLTVALLVKLTSKGPVFFKQDRHGINGKVFKMYKFRSMKLHKEEEGKITQAKKNDSRITAVGAFLRKSSLDELPQFLNVIKGDMSIVGPRPHAVAHNVYYREYIDSYMKRHQVKPGITGWAQINGWRGETDTMEKMEKRVEYDLYYIDNWSVMFDIQIIIMTIFKGFISKNAY